MQLHDLAPAPGSTKERKRVGRGQGSGRGKTATRGQDGQKSRSGGGKGPGFEGGQTPLARRLPKLPGFKSQSHTDYAPVNVQRLEANFQSGDIVDGDSLAAKGIIKRAGLPVKILGQGQLQKSLTVRVDKVSSSASAKIVAAGGHVEAPC